MDSNRLNTFRRALSAESADLHATMENARATLQVGRAADAVEDRCNSQERDQAASDLERATWMLRQVEEAQKRIERGEYGGCVVCRRPIQPKRLAALPWAEFCLTCEREVGRERGLGDAA